MLRVLTLAVAAAMAAPPARADEPPVAERLPPVVEPGTAPSARVDEPPAPEWLPPVVEPGTGRPAPERRRGRGLVTAGTILIVAGLGVMVLGGILAAAVSDDRPEDAYDEITQDGARGVAAGVLVVGGASIGTGIVLLILSPRTPKFGEPTLPPE